MTVFDGLFGNEQTKERLTRALRCGTLPHAFIIKGPSGSGKHTLAQEIAAAVFCENKNDSNLPFPCRKCRTCKRVFAHQFTDIKYLSKPTDKSSIGVGEVRAFREDMFLSPSEADAKVYVLENAESMTVQAQNALLKILEEPPGRMYVFLLTESEDKILTTVKSRAQRISMERFDIETLSSFVLLKSEMARALQERSASEFKSTLMRANGTIGQALSLLDPVCVSEENDIRETVNSLFLASLPGASYETIYKAVKLLPNKRDEFRVVTDHILSAVRDLIAVKNGMENGPLLYYLSMEDALSAAEKWKMKKLFGIYEIYKNAAEQNAKNGNLSLISAEIITATLNL